jgi:uncharacterized damage-inducible protein DinB
MRDQVLRENLKECLKGGSAHITVEKVLSGIKPELYRIRPHKEIPSIYEQLEHMRLAQEDILRYTLDETWESPPWPEGYWPTDNDAFTEEKWKQTLSSFFDDLNEVMELVNNTNIELTSEIPHGQGRTYLREILLVVDHNAYHSGQIVQARKMLGNW